MKVMWVPPPQRPEARQGEVHVWFCDFSGITDFADGSRILSEAERQRSDRFRPEESRLTFVGSHLFLRWVLGAYLGIAGAQVAFASEAGGKPCLDKAVHSAELTFNLSHSHKSAACVVTSAAAVGIDIERPDPKLCEFATAEQVFSLRELRCLQELEPDERNAAFFRGWTKKEAYAKCKGRGLAPDLKSIELGFGEGSTEFETVSLLTFECPNKDVASVALEGALGAVVFRELQAESLMRP